jgi:hypothetical protein
MEDTALTDGSMKHATVGTVVFGKVLGEMQLIVALRVGAGASQQFTGRGAHLYYHIRCEFERGFLV